MASRPFSTNAVWVPTIGQDLRPLPIEQAWLATDVVEQYMALFMDCWDSGFPLVLAAAGRTKAKAILLHGGPDGHQAGRALDAGFNSMKGWPEFTIERFYKIAKRHGWWPLSAAANDLQHLDRADWTGKHQIEGVANKFPSLQAACEFVGNWDGVGIARE